MEKSIFTPDEQKIAVLPEEVGEFKTTAGIILSKEAQDRPEVGLIVAIGLGSKDIPMRYSLGDRVLYSEYAGLELRLNLKNHGDHDYKIMNQMDIMGKIEEI